MRVIGWIVVIFVGLVVFGSIFGGGDSNRAQMAAECAADKTAIDSVLQSWHDAGVVLGWRWDSEGAMIVTVEDRRWRDAPHDGKVSIGVAAYCQVVRPDGRGNVLIRGNRSGDIVASVIDGNYSD